MSFYSNTIKYKGGGDILKRRNDNDRIDFFFLKIH